MEERKRSAPYLILMGKFFLCPLTPMARVVACTGLYQRKRTEAKMIRLVETNECLQEQPRKQGDESIRRNNTPDSLELVGIAVEHHD